MWLFLACILCSIIITYLGNYLASFISSKLNNTSEFKRVLVNAIISGTLLYIAFRIILFYSVFIGHIRNIVTQIAYTICQGLKFTFNSN